MRGALLASLLASLICFSREAILAAASLFEAVAEKDEAEGLAAAVGAEYEEPPPLRALSWAIRGALLASLLASLICLSRDAI